MIVITGAAGFIASVLLSEFNKNSYTELVLVDDFNKAILYGKEPNYLGKSYVLKIEREDFPNWLKDPKNKVDWVIHLGARTDTTEFDKRVFDHFNLNYSKTLWQICVRREIPFIYASSAATYGNGDLGYDDNHGIVESLKPLNPYGESKNEFDRWVLRQKSQPPFWIGLKFFNVYGPNEYHKKRMASVIFHAFKQIQENGSVRLFRSHHPDFEDGKQVRDFIYVKDIADVINFLIQHSVPSGLYNLGTGKGRTFIDLAKASFEAIGKPEDIRFIDTPIDIRDTYQYFTQANMTKLRAAGYTKAFTSLEAGIKDYVQQYLLPNNYL